MFHKINCVRPLDGYLLEVSFACGETKIYNVAKLFSVWSSFDALRTVEGLFQQVKVDTGGYGISWNDEIDLSSEELYHEAI